MSDKFYVGERLVDFRDIKRDKPISKITLLWDEENGFSAGDASGLELTADCYFATAEIAEKVRAALAGYEYHAFAATGADIDPAAEPGDGVTACGVYSTLVRYSDDGTGYPDIEAPGEAELEEEFPAEGPLTRELKKKVTLGTSYEGVRITRANGLEVVKTQADGSETARAQLKSDLLAFYDNYGSPALYFDPESGRYMFRGDIVVDGNIRMAAGQITWTDGGIDSGISAWEAQTIIDRTLVSSPNIAGGKFYNLNQDTWAIIGDDRTYGADGSGPGLKLCNGVFQETAPIFEVWSGPFNNTGFSAKNHYFLDVDMYYDERGDAYSGVKRTSPRGIWDFSDADEVVGLYLRYA